MSLDWHTLMRHLLQLFPLPHGCSAYQLDNRIEFKKCYTQVYRFVLPDTQTNILVSNSIYKLVFGKHP